MHVLAQRSHDQRVPLVLTFLAGGVWGNRPGALWVFPPIGGAGGEAPRTSAKNPQNRSLLHCHLDRKCLRWRRFPIEGLLVNQCQRCLPHADSRELEGMLATCTG
jgi:hypothetical protein